MANQDLRDHIKALTNSEGEIDWSDDFVRRAGKLLDGSFLDDMRAHIFHDSDDRDFFAALVVAGDVIGELFFLKESVDNHIKNFILVEIAEMKAGR